MTSPKEKPTIRRDLPKANRLQRSLDKLDELSIKLEQRDRQYQNWRQSLVRKLAKLAKIKV
jgi:hypothetical protein